MKANIEDIGKVAKPKKTIKKAPKETCGVCGKEVSKTEVVHLRDGATYERSKKKICSRCKTKLKGKFKYAIN